MKYKGWHFYLRQQIRNVELAGRAHDAQGIFGRRSHSLQVVEPLHLLGRAVGKEQRREELSKCRIFFAPALFDDREQSPRVLRIALSSASRKASIQHQVADSLWMADGINDGHCAALRDAQQGKPLQLSGLDDAFQIANERFKRNVRDIPIGESVAALVVTNELIPRRKFMQ